MDLKFSSEDEAFRQEVRSFIEANYPAELRVENPETDLSKEQMLLWHRILHKKGWVASSWPKQYGGTGWTPAQRYIWGQETLRAGTIPPLTFNITMVGPVVYTFGNDEQKKRFLPRILSGDDWWCQGYSEPGAGSDLASLQCKAVRHGDQYIVNGQKIWTSLAQHADWIFCLVRTTPSPKPQEGISFLLIDMKTPGITVRPIITIDGSHEVNEVFFENVAVPVANLIGEQDKGWTYAKFLLGHERSVMGATRSRGALHRLKSIACVESVAGVPLMQNNDFAREIAKVEIDLTALEATEAQLIAAMSRGENPGANMSIIKVRGTEIFQRISELSHQAIGQYGLVNRMTIGSGDNSFVPGPEYGRTATEKYLNLRKVSIYGGSNEIQRNILAKMALGL